MAGRQYRRSKYKHIRHEPQYQRNIQSEPIPQYSMPQCPTPQYPILQYSMPQYAIPQYTTNTALVLTQDRLQRVAAWELYFNKKHKTEAKNSIWPAHIQNLLPQNHILPAQSHPTEEIQPTPLCLWHYGVIPLDGKYREYKLFD